jgi:glycine/D-amino acid oxidase-like deaminating enzyme
MAPTTPTPRLPFPNPTKAYWQTPTHPLSDHRTTPSLPPSAKYVIIGSGITGASLAHKLLLSDPSSPPVLLEARQASSGATGRNGGHCRPGDYLEFQHNVARIGVEDALRVENLEETNVRAVKALVEEYGIECDFRAKETLDVFVDPKLWEEAKTALKVREEVGVPSLTEHRVWSEKETREELLFRDGLGAISYPSYVLSPYKLVCALLEMSLKKGLNLQTNTPVLEVKQDPDSKVWTVRTDRGEIKAEKVILATNAYTAALYPQISGFITPKRGQMATVRPGSNIAGNPIFKRTAAIHSANGYPYYQSRNDDVSGAGDIVFGKFSLFTA